MSTHRGGVARIAGLTLAGVGAAHFTNPRLFASLTPGRSPRQIRLHTYLNGAVGTAVGLGITHRRARPLATFVGIGYGARVLGNATRTESRP
jgi:uncharacterized membrane protein